MCLQNMRVLALRTGNAPFLILCLLFISLGCQRFSSTYDHMARSCGEHFEKGQRVFQIQRDGKPIEFNELASLTLNEADIKGRLSSRGCFALADGEHGTIHALHKDGESFAKAQSETPAAAVLPLVLERYTPLFFTPEVSSEVFRDFCESPSRIIYQGEPEVETTLNLGRFARIADLKIEAKIRPEFAEEIKRPLELLSGETTKASFRLPSQKPENPRGTEKYLIELEASDAFGKKISSPPCSYVINKVPPLLSEVAKISYSRGMYVEWEGKKTIEFAFESEIPLSRVRLSFFSLENQGPALKVEEYRPFQLEGRLWSLIVPKPLLSGPQRVEISITDEAGYEVLESILVDFGRRIYMDGGVRIALTSADERYLLLSSYQGLVEVYDLREDSRRVFQEKFSEPATHAAISADGTRIALRFSGESYIIELGSGQQTVLAKPLAVSGIEFKPDGSELFALTIDSVFTWFDSRSGQARFERRLDPGENYRNWHLSSDQRELFVALGSGKIVRYALNSADPSGVSVASCPAGRTSQLTYRQDGRLLVYNCNGKLYRQSLDSGNPPDFLIELDAPPFTMRFSHKGQHLAVGSELGEWFVLDMERLSHFPASRAEALEGKFIFPAQVTWLEFSPDDSYLLLGGDDGTAKLFSMQSLSLSDSLKTEGTIETGGFLKQGSRYFVGSMHGSLLFKSIQKPRLLIDTEQKVFSLALGGKDLLAVGTTLKRGADASERPGAYLFRTKDGHRLNKLEHQARVNTVSFTSDGKWLLTGSEDSTAQLLHIPSEELGRFRTGSKAIRRAFFSDDGMDIGLLNGLELSLYSRSDLTVPYRVLRADSWIAEAHFAGPRWIASGAADNKARIFDRILDRTVLELEEKARVWDTQISPDRKIYAHISDLPEIVLRSLESNPAGELQGSQELTRIRIPSGGENLSFSPSSQYLAWSLWNGETYLFNIQTRQLRLLTCRSAKFATKPQFSLDGRYLAVGQGSSAVVYRTSDGKPLQVVLHRDLVSATLLSKEELVSGSADGHVYLTPLDSSGGDKASCDRSPP